MTALPDTVEAIRVAHKSGEITNLEAAVRLRAIADRIKVGGVCLAQVRPAHRRAIHRTDTKWAGYRLLLQDIADSLEAKG